MDRARNNHPECDKSRHKVTNIVISYSVQILTFKLSKYLLKSELPQTYSQRDLRETEERERAWEWITIPLSQFNKCHISHRQYETLLWIKPTLCF